MARSAWILGWMVAVACGDDRAVEDAMTSSGPSSSGGEQPLCTGQTMVDDCCCFARPESGAGLDIVCETEMVCPRIGIQCAQGLADCSVVSSSAEMQCALGALAGRRTGMLSWGKTSLTAPWGVSQLSEYTRLYVADESVVRVTYTYDEDRTTIQDISRWRLKPPDFFEQCMFATSLEQQMDCVEHGVEDHAAELCVPSYAFLPL